MKMNKVEILDYLKNNPDWVLRYYNGIRFKGWWVLKNIRHVSNTINLDGRSAQAASKELKQCPMKRYGEIEFILKNHA